MTIAEDRATTEITWTQVCPASSVVPDRGIAALVDGVAVAIFRLSPIDQGQADEWRAVSHLDPSTQAPVMARGLVGSVGTGPIVIPTLASPLHKQRYNLRTGYCLDDDEVRLEVFEVAVHDRWVRGRGSRDGTPR